MTSANMPTASSPEPTPAATPAAADDRVGRESKSFYIFARTVVRIVLPLLARRRTVNIENVPQSGPVILAVNHIAWIDIPLASLMVPRVTHYMAKIELFNQPVLGGIMRLLGAFPVRRGEGDRESLRVAERLLAQGNILVIFPEGHRSGGHLIKAHPGMSLIALRSGAPVVPVAISGSEAGLQTLSSAGHGQLWQAALPGDQWRTPHPRRSGAEHGRHHVPYRRTAPAGISWRVCAAASGER